MLQAANLDRLQNNEYHLARDLEVLSWIYSKLGQKEKSFETYNEALGIFKEHGI